MKIAVPVDNGIINDHFGHSEIFVVYTISSDKQVESALSVASIQGCGCKSGIAEVLAGQGVSVMLAGNIGAGAINHLQVSGIQVIRGCHGEPGRAVTAYLEGTLSDVDKTCTSHTGCENH